MKRFKSARRDLKLPEIFFDPAVNPPRLLHGIVPGVLDVLLKPFGRFAAGDKHARAHRHYDKPFP